MTQQATPAATDQFQSYQLFIGGDWVEPADGNRFDSVNPYTGRPWASLPDAGAADVDRAVAAARAVLPAWRETPAKQRGRLMWRLADLIEANAESLAAYETTDNGKLLREMLGQVKSLPDYYRYWAGWADKVHGDVIPLDKPDTFSYLLREPVGVIGAIVPWNSPLLLLTWKLAPMLALGNVVVAKPSEYASASTLEFARLVAEAGFPAGVFNVVTGYGKEAGAALVSHPGVDQVSFTGGPATGRRVAEQAAQHLAPVSLELGGKSPNIVFDDADLDNAVVGAIAGIFGASGQTCIAGSRLLVQETVADELVERVAARAKGIRLGDPSAPETEMGPVCFPEHLERIRSFVDDAVAAGAEVVTGGRRPASNGPLAHGYFYEPTVLRGVTPRMRVVTEEIFGPVLVVLPFRDEDEAVALANDSDYGLAAGVWTSSLERALRLPPKLDVGIVWVNTYRMASYATPWGGRKHSGYGVESSAEAIREYTRAKSVTVNLAGSIADPFVVR